MTRNECTSIIKDKSHPLHKELSHTFRINYNKCRKYYDKLGYKGYTLHHKIVNCDNYEEWNIDEIEPMTREEHSRLHMTFYKQGLGSMESQKKAHETLNKKYAIGELVIWNKGLTKEIDDRIKESPRKGKTGKDFPFLCASKKGKSGGWNKNISDDDPRKENLKWSEERKQHQSEILKKLSSEGKNDSFIYACKGTIFINNGIKNKRIKKEEEIPDGWVKGKLTYKKLSDKG